MPVMSDLTHVEEEEVALDREVEIVAVPDHDLATVDDPVIKTAAAEVVLEVVDDAADLDNKKRFVG